MLGEGQSVYFVRGEDGKDYGPADLETLRQWAAQGRIIPMTQVFDQESGEIRTASQIPGLLLEPQFPPSQTESPYPRPLPQAPSLNWWDKQFLETSKIILFGIFPVCCTGLLCIVFCALGMALCTNEEAKRNALITLIISILVFVLLVFLSFVHGVYSSL